MVGNINNKNMLEEITKLISNTGYYTTIIVKEKYRPIIDKYFSNKILGEDSIVTKNSFETLFFEETGLIKIKYN